MHFKSRIQDATTIKKKKPIQYINNDNMPWLYMLNVGHVRESQGLLNIHNYAQKYHKSKYKIAKENLILENLKSYLSGLCLTGLFLTGLFLSGPVDKNRNNFEPF